MKTIFYFSSLALVLLLVISCGTDENSITKVKREGEPDVDYVNSDDREMIQAIAESKRHFPDFIAALQDSDSLTYNFAIKVPFLTPDGSREHLWLTEVSMEGDSLYGVVSNEPLHTKEVSYGQSVAISLTR